jgi:hypothetical protein
MAGIGSGGGDGADAGARIVAFRPRGWSAGRAGGEADGLHRSPPLPQFTPPPAAGIAPGFARAIADEDAFDHLRAYWAGLSRGGQLPARADVDPRAIAGMLDRTLLIERIGTGIGRIRLAGLALCDLLGMELRGMPLSALIDPTARLAAAEAVEKVFAIPASAEMWLRAESDLGLPRLAARLLLLPLRGDEGRVDRAIGAMVIEGRIGRAPRRFDIHGLRLGPVVAQHGAEAEAHAAVEPSRRTGPVRAHLRLVSSADRN